MKFPSAPVNILLVEDNEADIRLLKEAFKESKLTVNITVAVDGEQALNYLKKQPPYESVLTPNLILLDFNLPKIDGKQVLAVIQSSEKLKKIPLLILTSSNNEYEVLKQHNLTTDQYLIKSLDFSGYQKMIKQIEDFWMESNAARA